MPASVLLLVFLLSSVYCVPFQVNLSLPSQILLGDDVICQVTISNPTDDDLFLFNQATPLERTISNIFGITTNGSKLYFDGPFFKRLAVSMKSEGTELKAHSDVTASVDLSSVYPLHKRGSYVAYLSSQIYFLKYNDSLLSYGQLQSVPVKFTLYGDEFALGKKTLGEKHRLERSHFDKHNQFGHAKSNPRRVKFDGTYTDEDKSEGNQAWSDAYNGIIEGILPGNSDHFKRWFGLLPSFRSKKVLRKIKSAMRKKQFFLHFHGSECAPGYFAYTYFDSRFLYLCDEYISSPATGYDSKMGVLVHEISHAVAYTEDFAYGQKKCLKLAKKSPPKALRNADNYEYYVESLNLKNGRQCNWI